MLNKLNCKISEAKSRFSSGKTSKIILVLIGLFFSICGFSQDETGFQRSSSLDKATVRPSGASGSSLGQFGESSISHYNGQAHIQIPVTSIAGKTLSIPVGLLHEGTAPKMNAREGMVGLSWNLTCDYSISRSVVANPDLEYNYFSKKDSIDMPIGNDQFVENRHLRRIAQHFIETQPDHFYLSYPGGAVKFYITPDKQIIQKEHKNLTIIPSYDFEDDITQFIVKDDKGITYEYKATEEIKLTIDDQFQGDLGPAFLQYQYYSTWRLTKIIGTNFIEQFIFSYDTAPLAHTLDVNPYNARSETYNTPSITTCCGTPSGLLSSDVGSTSTSEVLGRKFLKSIKYVLGTSDTLETLLFETSDTKDLCSHAADSDQMLDRIRCLKGKDGLVNIIDYDFGYDCSTGRLTLKSMQEKSADGLTVKPPYQLSYHSGTLGNYIDTDIDHFGYQNDAPNGNNLLPRITPQGFPAFNSGGANRAPSFNPTLKATISKITYPTGGYTQYNWEMNRVAGLGAGVYYDYAPTQNGADDRDAGGLRIKSIEQYDCDDTRLLKRSYKYVKSGLTSSSGTMLNEPIYTERTIYSNCPEGQMGGGGCNIEYTCDRTNISASSRSVLGAIKGSHVGYSRIEEIIEANDGSNETAGKTVYFFKNKKLNQFGAKDDVENGLLVRKEIYNAAGDTLDINTYTWSTDEGENRKYDLYSAYRVIPALTQDNKPTLCQLAGGGFVWRTFGDDADCTASTEFPSKFVRLTTQHEQYWVYQSEMTNTRYFYFSNGNLSGKVSVTTDYVYGDTTTNQPTEVSILNSDGKVYKTVTHFLNSYDDTQYPVEENGAIASLDAKGMTSFPLVQAQFIDGQLVYKTKLDYKPFGLRVFPHKLYESFPTKTDVLAEVFDNYDAVGNVQQGHPHYEHASSDFQSVAMLYSHNNSRMAAQVVNAKLGEVAYTGFDTDDTAYQGGWSIPDADLHVKFNGDARTGIGHYQPSTAVTATTFAQAGDYYVSFYTKDTSSITLGGSGVTILRTKQSGDHPDSWRFVRHKINLNNMSSITVGIAANALIDELRLYPADALMTTYSYDKDSRLLNGTMDENALPTRYDYDDLLRSTGVRNFDDFSLSFTQYQYKNLGDSHNFTTNFTVLQSGFELVGGIQSNIQNPLVSIKTNQFFDGIGRTIQTTLDETSAAKNDYVQHIEYDKFGRTIKQFLPYSITTGNGAFRASAKTEQESFYNVEFSGEGTKALIETELEFSPLNRVFSQTPQGTAFESNPTEVSYLTNGLEEVRNFHIMGDWYEPTELYKVISKDENGNSVISYTDKIGRQIMQDIEGSKTYFLYDANGFLEQVIQPEASQKGHDTDMLTYLDNGIRDGSFLYTYDSEHRMKTKVVPGCQAYTYFYDDLDQLVMTEDGNGFKTFIKYDKVGRQILTGRYTGTAVPTTNEVVFEERSTSAPHYYTTNQSFPADGNIEVYNVTYYDDYDFNNDNTEESSYLTTTGYDATDYNFVRGKATSVKVAILENQGATPSTYLNHYFFFDQFQRLLSSKKDNHLGGTDTHWHKYAFRGWLLNSKRVHSTNINGNAQNVTIHHRYEHDHVGRDTAYYHQIEGQAEVQVCEKSYNEREEIAQKKIGKTSGGSFLQTLDYGYNIRRWLTSINDPNTLGTDLFGMNLRYDAILQMGETPNFNGNISSITWKNQPDDIEKTYKFDYDNLNRLTTASYSQIAPNPNSITTESFDQFNTAYSYDRNGNLGTLSRNGRLPLGGFGQIDNLAYDNADDGKLNKITESSTTEAGFKSAPTEAGEFYEYDGNGNTTYDDHKGMFISYNFLDLPEAISKQEANGDEIGRFEWQYDAFGTKLSKKVITNNLTLNVNPIVSKEYIATETIASNGTVEEGSNVTFTAGECITLTEGFVAKPDFLARIQASNLAETRDYVDGIEYVNGQIEAVYFSDGRVKYEGNNTTYEYVLSDNQGNIRSLFKEGVGGVAEAIETYSYYPNGALHSQATALNCNYTFGGKELQGELDLGWSDFGARCFDNWSSKWQGVDNLAEMNAGHSPYLYASANPVRFSDPTGMISEDEDGMMEVSTDLWGGGRNQDFRNESANNAQSNAKTTQLQQVGYKVANKNEWDWLSSSGQLADDITTDRFNGYVYNPYAGEEVSHDVVGNGADITYEGAWISEGFLAQDFSFSYASIKGFDTPVGSLMGGTIGGLDLLSGVGVITKIPTVGKILNSVNTSKRVGSAAWKSRVRKDFEHFFPNIVDNYASFSSRFSITGGDGIVRELHQIGGSLRGEGGIFEWIVEGAKVSHRRFIKGGIINGKPNQIVKK